MRKGLLYVLLLVVVVYFLLRPKGSAMVVKPSPAPGPATDLLGRIGTFADGTVRLFKGAEPEAPEPERLGNPAYF